MAITLTDEQRALVEAVRDFAARECGTREQLDKLTDHGQSPHNAAMARRIGELGWFGAPIPEDYGGAGGSTVDMCLLLEELAHGRIPVNFYSVSLIVGGAYQKFGTPEQKAEILGNIVRGGVESIAMSEPDSGSDVGSLKCAAVRSNGGFVLNGQKTWITGAHEADNILVVCRTDREGSKHQGLSMISVPAGTEGLEVRGIHTMGGGQEVNDVFLTDCHVPGERVLGEIDGGWMQLMAGLNTERLIIAAQMLGIAQRAFDDTLSYVQERKQFGRPIGSFQALKHRIADLATELECSRLLVYDVAQTVDGSPGRLFPREASMAKLKVTETAKKIALEGMQMMGGYGYASEYDMEHYVRATLPSTIYGGTNEIQRDIIGTTLGL
jgi:alkylation response protein AidB-like acyl-CoA dehydrogenase